MALEVFAFRSLFRNLRTELVKDPDNPEGARLIHWSYKWLWLGAIAFHYAFLIVILRHLRFFTEPVPGFVHLLDHVDGFFQFFTPGGLPERRGPGGGRDLPAGPADHQPHAALHLPGRGLLPPAADPGHRASTGILMRYFFKTDIVAVKELAMGLVTLHPKVPAGIGPIFSSISSW